ncbi:MAG: hypothetical protein J6C51_02225, partial [Clostridia bacterium]|nr:hypothetical protein [Clostridia bacterium]
PTAAWTEDVTITTAKDGKTYTVPADSTVLDAALQIFAGTSDKFMMGDSDAPQGLRYTDVGGYAFFAVDYLYVTSASMEWLDKELTRLEEKDPSKPIIVTSHMPSNVKTAVFALTEVLDKHQNVVYFSGHTHVPMQNASAFAQREGFTEIVLGPGNHGNYGVSGSGTAYNNYNMKQSVIVEVDANGNTRVTALDMSFEADADGNQITSQVGSAVAEKPLVIREAYLTRPTETERIRVAYDSVVTSTSSPLYVAPSFDEETELFATNATETGVTLTFEKAYATNLIKYYAITVTDSEGNVVLVNDPLKNASAETLNIASRYIVYGLYENYPETFTYQLKTGYTTEDVTDENGEVTDTVTTYTFVAGETYTVSLVAYDDLGMATEAITATFTVAE